MNEIKYNGEKIPYTIKKFKIKNLYIHIKEGQVIVKAPVRLQEKYIQEFINKKTKWIYENVKRYEQKPKVEEKLDIKDVERLKEIIQKSIQKYSKTLEVIPNNELCVGAFFDVALHEMCHLKEMNHSTNFWELVEKNMPDYKIYKNKLKEY